MFFTGVSIRWHKRKSMFEVSKTAIKKFKVIWVNPINVDSIKRGVDEIFEAEATTQEIKNLVKAKYIEEAKGDQ